MDELTVEELKEWYLRGPPIPTCPCGLGCLLPATAMILVVQRSQGGT